MFTSLRARLAGCPNLERPLGRRGAVAVLVGVSFVPMMVGTVAVIDVSRMIATKAALQRIADNAALSGAAMYKAYTATDAFKTLAINMATGSFCNSVTNLPGGFTLAPTAGSAQACGGTITNGPLVTGQISGYQVGTRGLNASSGCTATNTVAPAPIKCAFAITVSATATMTSLSANILGNSTVTITSTAVNPFLDLGSALSVNFLAAAENANSIWVYPATLDNDGNPDFSTDAGARPDHSACTGDPSQLTCGTYTMLATNFNAAPPQVMNGVVTNPKASSAVITATTPLGFAFSSAANANNRSAGPDYVPYPICKKTLGWYGQTGKLTIGSEIATRMRTSATSGTYSYITNSNSVDCSTPSVSHVQQKMVDPTTGCVYPYRATYGTVTQMYKTDASGVKQPLLPWPLVTHWFYSSYLGNNISPMQPELVLQASSAGQQVISPVEDDAAAEQRALEGVSATCPSSGVNNGFAVYPASTLLHKPTVYNTTYSNCALTIVRDVPSPAGAKADPSYVSPANDNNTPSIVDQFYTASNYKTCWTPETTPGNLSGAQYGIIECSQFKGHTFTYFWNDASGKGDDTDYNNGSLTVQCTGQSHVVLVD